MRSTSTLTSLPHSRSHFEQQPVCAWSVPFVANAFERHTTFLVDGLMSLVLVLMGEQHKVIAHVAATLRVNHRCLVVE